MMQDNTGYEQDYGSSRRRIASFLVAAFIIVTLAAVVAAAFAKFGAKSGEMHEISQDQEELIIISQSDAEDQARVRAITGYDWAVILNSPMDDDGMAMRAVPYLASLELETAVLQAELLNASGIFVDEKILGELPPGETLENAVTGMVGLEEAFYGLGLPSGAAHAARLKHLELRLNKYGPPKGPIYDDETKLFAQEHLGMAVDSYEQWYARIGAKYNLMVHEMAELQNLNTETEEVESITDELSESEEEVT